MEMRVGGRGLLLVVRRPPFAVCRPPSVVPRLSSPVCRPPSFVRVCRARARARSRSVPPRFVALHATVPAAAKEEDRDSERARGRARRRKTEDGRRRRADARRGSAIRGGVTCPVDNSSRGEVNSGQSLSSRASFTISISTRRERASARVRLRLQAAVVVVVAVQEIRLRVDLPERDRAAERRQLQDRLVSFEDREQPLPRVEQPEAGR